jgi:phosphatidylglycerophosphatase A
MRAPSLHFLCRHPAHFIALGGGSGLSPVGPGTAGTLLAWGLWLSFHEMGGSVLLGLLTFLLGWWACTHTAKALNKPDPSCVVWDEIWAFGLLLTLWPHTHTQSIPLSSLDQCLAFILFRLFDIFKPFPIGWVDRQFKGFGWRGGLGIMLDDVLAAGMAWLVAQLVYFLL